MAGLGIITKFIHIFAFVLATCTAANYRYLTDSEDIELPQELTTCEGFADNIDVSKLTFKRRYQAYGFYEELFYGNVTFRKQFNSPVPASVVLLRPIKEPLVIYSTEDYCNDFTNDDRSTLDLFRRLRFRFASYNNFSCPLRAGTIEMTQYDFILQEGMAELAQYINREGTMQQRIGDSCFQFRVIRPIKNFGFRNAGESPPVENEKYGLRKILKNVLTRFG